MSLKKCKFKNCGSHLHKRRVGQAHHKRDLETRRIEQTHTTKFNVTRMIEQTHKTNDTLGHKEIGMLSPHRDTETQRAGHTHLEGAYMLLTIENSTTGQDENFSTHAKMQVERI